MQTWYDAQPRAKKKLLKAVYERLSREHSDLQAYLDYLQQNRPNALLAMHPPPAAEVEFWQGQINDCRHRLAGMLPVTDRQLKTESLLYLPFLYHVLTIVEAAAAGDAGELQKCFNLVPQSINQAPFIQVTAQRLESTSDAHTCEQYLVVPAVICACKCFASVCTAAAKPKQLFCPAMAALEEKCHLTARHVEYTSKE